MCRGRTAVGINLDSGPGPDESAEYDDVLALLHHIYLPRLDGADLVSYDATAREVEDRAWRTGGGTLYAGFQSLSAFETQVPVYERLVDDIVARLDGVAGYSRI
jgi:hypothetical protein